MHTYIQHMDRYKNKKLQSMNQNVSYAYVLAYMHAFKRTIFFPWSCMHVYIYVHSSSFKNHTYKTWCIHTYKHMHKGSSFKHIRNNSVDAKLHVMNDACVSHTYMYTFIMQMRVCYINTYMHGMNMCTYTWNEYIGIWMTHASLIHTCTHTHTYTGTDALVSSMFGILLLKQSCMSRTMCLSYIHVHTHKHTQVHTHTHTHTHK